MLHSLTHWSLGCWGFLYPRNSSAALSGQESLWQNHPAVCEPSCVSSLHYPSTLPSPLPLRTCEHSTLNSQIQGVTSGELLFLTTLKVRVVTAAVLDRLGEISFLETN